MEIEQRTIDFIPEAERYGKERDLFPVWFGANVNLASLVTGALLVGMGLNLFWAAFSIVVGVSIGTILVASHSVQGPRLGIPQMIRSVHSSACWALSSRCCSSCSSISASA